MRGSRGKDCKQFSRSLHLALVFVAAVCPAVASAPRFACRFETLPPHFILRFTSIYY